MKGRVISSNMNFQSCLFSHTRIIKNTLAVYMWLRVSVTVIALPWGVLRQQTNTVSSKLWGFPRQKTFRGKTEAGQREELCPQQRDYEEGGFSMRKAGSSLRKPCSWASTPKTRVPTLLFMLSPIPLTLRGWLPHHLS